MSIEKITNLTGSTIQGLSRTAQKTSLSDNKTANIISDLSKQDILGESLVKKRVLGLFDLDKTLPFANNTMESFDEISPDKLLLVHLTDYLPEQGKIQTLYDMTQKPRNTLHFSLNHAVVNPLGAGGTLGWTKKQYALFLPFKKTFAKEKPIGGKYNDFMFEGSLSLPEGSFMYRQNPDIKKGKILFSDASEVLKGTKGVTLIEANEPVYDMTDLLIEKLGYTNLKDLHARGTGSNMKSVNAVNDINAMLDIGKKLESGELSWEDYFKMFNIDIEKALSEENMEKSLNFEESWKQTWMAFTKNIKCDNTLHCSTMYAKLEDIFEILDMLNMKKSDWSENGVNYKDILISAFDKILESKNKKPDFIDIEKAKEIISNSSSPQEALDKIQSAFKIKSFFDGSQKYTIEELTQALTGKIESLKSVSDEDFISWNY